MKRYKTLYIDAVPSDNRQVVFILVEPGIYNEKIVVPADKPFIKLSGSKPNGTIITGSDSGNIFESATFTMLASDFVGRYLTIQSTLPSQEISPLILYKTTLSTIACSLQTSHLTTFLHLLHRILDLIAILCFVTMAAFIFYVTLFTLMASTPRADAAQTSTAALFIRVDQSGKGDYEKIQDAIDAVPSDNKEVVFILVEPGTYNEKIIVPADKPFITLSGSKPNGTVITGSDSGNIFESATFTVLASDFVGRYLTIQNTYGAGAKAVALRVSGDRAAFFGCRILSYQDTLLDDTGRHYYSNCYIEGAVDFIFGNAASLFERCHLHTLSEGDASITAQRRESPSEETGFTFLGCKITGVRTAVLGRPWGPYSRVIFALTYMSNVIL
ncbi:hypothetical protein Gotri_025789, partial [Gossypium trilobum]|nr:hypothetical protein [Gossypium trilobum]